MQFNSKFSQPNPSYKKRLPKISGVSKLVKKWQTTGSVCDKKRPSRRNVVTEDKVQDIQAQSKMSPQKTVKTTGTRNWNLTGFYIKSHKIN
jgi:hypothetical protein